MQHAGVGKCDELAHSGAIDRDGEARRCMRRRRGMPQSVDESAGRRDRHDACSPDEGAGVFAPNQEAIVRSIVLARAELAPARVGAALAWLVALPSAGCISEYHPEYHPETNYSYVQNIVTVVTPPPSREPAYTWPLPPPLAVRPVDERPAPAETEHHVVRRPRASHITPALRATGTPRDVQYAPVFVADDAR
jgi:hypothetical protein